MAYMDANQLRREVKWYTDELIKNEQELHVLTIKLNDLKRKMPENKRKLEAYKRDLSAQDALQKRRAFDLDQKRKAA